MILKLNEDCDSVHSNDVSSILIYSRTKQDHIAK